MDIVLAIHRSVYLVIFEVASTLCYIAHDIVYILWFVVSGLGRRYLVIFEVVSVI